MGRAVACAVRGRAGPACAQRTGGRWQAGAGAQCVPTAAAPRCRPTTRRTRLATRVSELLACEQHPVLRLAVGSDESYLWAATISPSVHRWEVEVREPPAAAALPVSPRSPMAGAAGVPPISGSHFIAAPSAGARARLSFDLYGAPGWVGVVGGWGGGDASAAVWLLPAAAALCQPPPVLKPATPAHIDAMPPPHIRAGTRPTSQQLQPAAATPGIPPIQHASVLTDRRHVLTQDAEGRVLMWDISVGEWMEVCGCPSG